MASGAAGVPQHSDFSLTPGGPFDGLLAQIGLMRPDSPRRPVRALLAALITWLPLLLLSLFTRSEGEAPDVTFFNDIPTHVRFLLVAPLLILAEGNIGARTRMVASHFLTSGLVDEQDGQRFVAAGRQVRKLLSSGVVELILLALAVTFTALAIRRAGSDGVLVWYEKPGSGGEQLTVAGWWYACATPLVGFLFLRWGWRYLIWCLFLLRMARLNLRVATSHPDRAGGLGFINIGQRSFAMVAMAISCVVSAVVGKEILYHGGTLVSLRAALITIIVAVVIVGVAPLVAFAKPLAGAQRRGMLAYGKLSVRYVQDFERKWLGEGAPRDEPILGSGDIQSLADLGGGYERLDNIRTVPIDKRTVIGFALAAALPMAPLTLTVMPIKDLVKLLLKSVL